MKRNKEEKHITLKEAAEISGYAPDYIGQLIRRGKLPGKQVYCTVAWTTTEEAVRQYMQRAKGQKENLSPLEKLLEKLQQIKAKILFEIKLARLIKTVLYLAIILSVGFSLLLFFIFSVSIEKSIQQRAIDKIEHRISNE